MSSGRIYIGIDAGSSATKCVVLSAGDGRLLRHSAVPSGFDYVEAAKRAMGEALRAAGAEERDIAGGVATGYGRKVAAEALGYRLRASGNSRQQTADSRQPRAESREPMAACLTEITCHARGAREWYPAVRHVIDIGGQDTKVIRLCDRGRMADYRMNAKCAAGTGTFLESIAVRLAIPLREIDDLAMQSTGKLSLNSYCTVFTSTEVLERIKDGEPKQDIAMGLFRAIAARVVEMISTAPGSGDDPIAATGGVVTHSRAMVRALEEALEREVHLPPLPQHAGAYGAALLAREGVGETSAGTKGGQESTQNHNPLVPSCLSASVPLSREGRC